MIENNPPNFNKKAQSFFQQFNEMVLDQKGI